MKNYKIVGEERQEHDGKVTFPQVEMWARGNDEQDIKNIIAVHAPSIQKVLSIKEMA